MSKVRIFPSVWRGNTPNLRGIRDNLPAFGTWQIYSLSLARHDVPAACILVFMRTARCLFLYTRIRPDHTSLKLRVAGHRYFLKLFFLDLVKVD